MKKVGDGKDLGRYTGLSVGQEFANAVLHSLRNHKKAIKRADGGAALPIDEATWQKVFELEFPKKENRNDRRIQRLTTYRSYYNNGVHGLGYDRKGRFDFGEGDRQDEAGKKASASQRVYGHEGAVVEPMDAIRLAKQLWEDFHEKRNDRGDIPTAAKTAPARRNEVNPSEVRLRLAEQELEKERFFEQVIDDDNRTLRLIVIRRGQPQFRKRLIKAYRGRCAITDCDAESALEAAHIVPYAESRRYFIAHGLLLRADIHTLFDLDLIGIDPNSRSIVIGESLRGSSYEELSGRPLSPPLSSPQRPSDDVLQSRWTRFLANCGR